MYTKNELRPIPRKTNSGPFLHLSCILCNARNVNPQYTVYISFFFSNAAFVSFLRGESFEVAPWQTYKPHYILLSAVEKKKEGGGCQVVRQQCLQKSLSKVLKPSPSKRQKMTAPYTAECVWGEGRPAVHFDMFRVRTISALCCPTARRPDRGGLPPLQSILVARTSADRAGSRPGRPPGCRRGQSKC